MEGTEVEMTGYGETHESPISGQRDCANMCEEEKPFVGKRFGSIEAARAYYEKYGKAKGFPVTLKTSQKTRNRDNRFTSLVYACSHYGSHAKKIDENVPVENRRMNTSTMRGGCKALMRILLDVKTNEYVVRKFEDDHNHSFVATPSKALMKTSGKKLPEGAKVMVELFRKENLPVSKVNPILGGDVLGFNNRACWNHLRDVRQKLNVGNAQSMSMYFQKRQAENPQFYYAIQPDGEGRAVNVFWVDARSRLSYQQFGDAVSFDTTYKTNKYDLPFAPFTAVNHHSHTIQFGCGLQQDETEERFLWLFNTWKDAMGGNGPTSLLTDSDPAMRKAVPKVFPNTRHRLCYWHIKMKFGEKLGHIYFKKSAFKREIKQCLKNTFRIDDFENTWKSLMKKYDLEENSWLKGLYEDREAWVPVYNNTTFFAGMHTTGRSEGVNSFFKDYVSSTTSLKEFVEKMDEALTRIESREREEDYHSEQKNRLVSENSFLLEHARELYTRNMYNKFRFIWTRVEWYKADVSTSEPNTYIVKFKRGTGTDHWVVKLDSSTFEGECECHYYEFAGLPCVHIMKVLSKLDVDVIPEPFIKKRWLKGANKFRSNDKGKTVSEKQYETMRFNHLCQEATQWACVAYRTEEGYKMFLQGIRELGEKISRSSIAMKELKEADPSEEVSEQAQVLLDPNVSRTKGRKKESMVNDKKNDARYKRPIEVAQQKKGIMCAICKSIHMHDKRNCLKRKKMNEEQEKRRQDDDDSKDDDPGDDDPEDDSEDEELL